MARARSPIANTDDLATIRDPSTGSGGASSGIGVLATYGYDDLGRRVSLTRGDGTVTTWTPDGVSRLAGLTDNLLGASRDQTVIYGYNGVSQLRTRQTTNDAYTYGGYDPSSVAATPNALNQLASVGGTSLTYNPNGNLTADNRGNAYTCNLDNQLTAKTGTGSLAYDPMGRLSALLPGTATVRFDYDGTDLIAESDAAGALTKRYVHGPGVDEPLVWYDGAGTTQRHWLSADERGSITAIADDTGRATRVNTYDENGVPDARNVGRFGYTGQAWLAEIGLSYYKARMYDPVFGRFLQTDPISYIGGLNLYAYAAGDAVNFIDPSGLDGEYLGRDANGLPIYRLPDRIYYGAAGGIGPGVSSPRGTGDFLGLNSLEAAQERRIDAILRAKGLNPDGSPQNNQKKVDCNSTARKFSEFGNRLALGAGGSALVFGALGAEPVAAILGGAALAGDGISFVAGGYVYLTEGDSGPLKSSFVGAVFGAVGGAGVKLFGGRSFSPVAGTRVTIRPSNTSVEAGKYASGQAPSAVPYHNMCR